MFVVHIILLHVIINIGWPIQSILDILYNACMNLSTFVNDMASAYKKKSGGVIPKTAPVALAEVEPWMVEIGKQA